MSRRRYNPDILKFLIVAILLMVGLEFFAGRQTVPKTESGPDIRAIDLSTLAPEAASAQTSGLVIGPVQPERLPQKYGPPEQTLQDWLAQEPPVFEGKANKPEAPTPVWKKYTKPVTAPADLKKIVVIIDDLGEDRPHTREAIALPGPVTLAFLPYPRGVRALAAEGRKAGHELLVHMPMEPLDVSLDPGSYVLRSKMDPAQFDKTLQDNLAAIDDYVGINNHMGSRLTRDQQAMRVVMAKLSDLGLLFVDSRTVGSSVAEATAADYLVPHAGRDVFLDDDPTLPGVRKQLATLESIARRRGHAVAIGHPKAATLAALKEWIPTLADKGFALVPVSMIVTTSPVDRTARRDDSSARHGTE